MIIGSCAGFHILCFVLMSLEARSINVLQEIEVSLTSEKFSATCLVLLRIHCRTAM